MPTTVMARASLARRGCLYFALPREDPMPDILQVTNLVKRFGALTAVVEVSFSFLEGICFVML